jgi:hypothetical protein
MKQKKEHEESVAFVSHVIVSVAFVSEFLTPCWQYNFRDVKSDARCIHFQSPLERIESPSQPNCLSLTE